jgi:hypothetical protein
MNDTGALYRAIDERILVQRPMRSDSVVVTGVRFQDATQMRLTQDNHMIDALSPDRAVQQNHCQKQSTALVSLDRTQTFLVTHVFHPVWSKNWNGGRTCRS